MSPLRAITIAGYVIAVIGLVFAFDQWGLNGMKFGVFGLVAALAAALALFSLSALVALFLRFTRDTEASAATLTKGLRNSARLVGISLPLISICYGFFGAASLILPTGSDEIYVYLPVWLASAGCVAAACGSMVMAILGNQLSNEALDRRGLLSFGG